MLRSYQYTEKPYTSYSMQSDRFWEEEVATAKRFVESHPIRQDEDQSCPVCGEKHGRFFYAKWNVHYLRCEQCRSIYAVADPETIASYRLDPEMTALRCDKEYQQAISSRRTGVWEEFLGWLSVRSFRFLKRNRDLRIIDLGSRVEEYCRVVRENPICGEYNLRGSILRDNEETIPAGGADLVLYSDQLKTETDPQRRLEEIRTFLKKDGLLILGARAGSGFDILTLREHNSQIYPYEHVFLPSVKGITLLLKKTGYEVLEVTTPGVMDVRYVLDSLDALDDRELFVKYLLSESDNGILQELQRFLQKSGMSSFVRVIARKNEDEI